MENEGKAKLSLRTR